MSNAETQSHGRVTCARMQGKERSGKGKSVPIGAVNEAEGKSQKDLSIIHPNDMGVSRFAKKDIEQASG